MGIINDTISTLKFYNSDVLPNVSILEQYFDVNNQKLNNLLETIKNNATENIKQNAFDEVCKTIQKQKNALENCLELFKEINKKIYALTATLMNGYNNLSEEEKAFVSQSNISSDLMLEKKQLTISNGVISFAIESKKAIEDVDLFVEKLKNQTLNENIFGDADFEELKSQIIEINKTIKSLFEELNYNTRLNKNILDFADQLKNI